MSRTVLYLDKLECLLKNGSGQRFKVNGDFIDAALVNNMNRFVVIVGKA